MKIEELSVADQALLERRQLEAELPECIRKELAELEEERAKVLSWAVAARAAEEAVAAVWTEPGLPPASVTVGRGIGSLNGVLLHVGHSWDKEKCVRSARQALPLLRELRRRGWRYKRHSDYEELGRRTYELVNPEQPAAPISMSVFFYNGGDAGDDGPACRFVKVGVEERPVYKLMCADSEATETLVAEELES